MDLKRKKLLKNEREQKKKKKLNKKERERQKSTRKILKKGILLCNYSYNLLWNQLNYDIFVFSLVFYKLKILNYYVFYFLFFRKRRSKDTQNLESATADESVTENDDNKKTKTKTAAQNSSSNESTSNPTDKFQQYQQDFNNAYTAAFQNSSNNVTDSDVNSAATTSQNYADLQSNVMTRIPYKKVISQQYNNDQATMEPVQSTCYYPPMNPFTYQ